MLLDWVHQSGYYWPLLLSAALVVQQCLKCYFGRVLVAWRPQCSLKDEEAYSLNWVLDLVDPEIDLAVKQLLVFGVLYLLVSPETVL